MGLQSGVVSISAGYHHTCAVTSAGAVKCWGSNLDGELGNGTKSTSYVPAAVTGLASGAVSVSAGQSHTCARLSSGGVKCWGYNAFGQLGNNTTTSSLVPVDVAAGGLHSCALLSSGDVKCWGRNQLGQLGNNSMVDSHVPVDAMWLASSVVAVSAGQDHTCVITTSGGAKCWGYNFRGQLGNNSFAHSNIPVDVVGF
jgi:alpha-tubulin suppressor-like RCC1 family protein